MSNHIEQADGRKRSELLESLKAATKCRASIRRSGAERPPGINVERCKRTGKLIATPTYASATPKRAARRGTRRKTRSTTELDQLIARDRARIAELRRKMGREPLR